MENTFELRLVSVKFAEDGAMETDMHKTICVPIGCETNPDGFTQWYDATKRMWGPTTLMNKRLAPGSIDPKATYKPGLVIYNRKEERSVLSPIYFDAEEAISALRAANKDYESSFTLTDPDCFQLRRRIGVSQFELYQVTAVIPDYEGRETNARCYSVSHEIVDISELTVQEINSTLDCYGYPALAEFQKECEEMGEGDIWRALLAEMCFELNAGCLSNLVCPAMTYGEAKAHICKMSGFQADPKISSFEKEMNSLAARINNALGITWDVDDHDAKMVLMSLKTQNLRSLLLQEENKIFNENVRVPERVNEIRALREELDTLQNTRTTLWIRGGIRLNLSKDELKVLLTEDANDSYELLSNILKNHHYLFDGDFYIPENANLPEYISEETEFNSEWDLDLMMP